MYVKEVFNGVQRVTRSVLLGLVLVAVACVGLADLRELQTRLASRFHTTLPGIDLRNGKELVVAFEDTVRLEERQYESNARFVEEFVRDSFPGSTGLEKITIGYVQLVPNGSDTSRIQRYVVSFVMNDGRKNR